MYDTILVPLDGSPFAEQVLPLAATIARRAGMCLDLVKVHRSHPVGYAQDTMLAALDVEGRSRALAGAYLERVAERIDDRLHVVRRLVDDPSPVPEVICGEAARGAAAMIAMTTHGRTGLLRLLRGSVADGVLRHATVPVLLWRSSDEPPPAPTGPPTHVLVALDGSTWAEMVLPAAAALARTLGARLTLLEVVANIPAIVPELVPVPAEVPYVGAGYTTAAMVDREATRRAVERAQAYVGHVMARVRSEHPDLVVSCHVLNEDHPAPAIVRMAHDIGADLIAMSTHGRGASRLVVGSTVDGVLDRQSGALLLVRPTVPVPRG